MRFRIWGSRWVRVIKVPSFGHVKSSSGALEDPLPSLSSSKTKIVQGYDSEKLSLC